MPGPGGGSRGGGFGGGGFGGGGRGFGGGGGFGGGYHHHHRPPRRPFFGFYRPYGYYGGGLFGGLLGIIMLPIIVIIISIAVIGIYVSSTVSSIANGGEIVYNEETFQDYAMGEYGKHFTDNETYEDNVLVVLLTSEDNSRYYCIAIVGDNVNYRINEMFGNETTAFGRAITGSIAENYKYSLDSNLAMAMGKMADSIEALNLKSSFTAENDMSNKAESKLVNYTDLTMTEKTVNDSLASFTETTGIPAVVVVETAETVFGKTMPVGSILFIIILVALVGFCIAYIVKRVREKKQYDKDFKGDSGTGFRGGLDNDTFN